MSDISKSTGRELAAMKEAGEEVLDCFRVLAKAGDNIVADLLRDQATFYEWDHYPKGDAYDHVTHSQYYYHAHPAEDRLGEHGHFHTFLRPKGMPTGMSPAPVPDYTPPPGDNDALSHLIAISMDKHGIPIGLFTTNRWVTGETWYRSADVSAMLDRFEMDLAWPSWPVNRWITGMLRLFRPQILELLQQRDVAVDAWQADHPERNVYEDRDFEITSRVSISVDEQVRATVSALEGQA